MKYLVLLLLVALAACASTRQPAVQIETVEVPVIRVETCVEPEIIPNRPDPLPKRPASLSSALDLAYAKVREWMGYGELADPIMRGCARRSSP